METQIFLRVLLALAGSAILVSSQAVAAVRYWDGTSTTADADGGTGTWQTVGAWDSAATAGTTQTFVSGSDTAVFGGLAGIVSLNADLTNAGALLFNTSGYTIQSSDLTVRTLTLNTATSQFNGTTFASTVDIVLATGTHTIGLTGTSTINGVLSGAQALAIGGTGTLVLANTANTFSGKLSLNQGTVEFKSIANVNGGASSLGSVTTIANGTIDLGTSSNQDANLVYSGTTNSSTDRVINLGTTNSARVATIEVAGTGNLTFTSAFTSAAGSATGQTRTLNLQGSNTGVGDIAAAIPTGGTNMTTSLTKNGTGTWRLSGSVANAYAGLTTVSGGTLELNKSGAVNAIAGGGLTIGGANNIAATVRYTGASTDMMGAGAVTIRGRGILDFNGMTDTIGNVSIVSTGATGTDPTPIINTAGGGNLTIGSLTLTPEAGLTSVVNAGTGTITLGGNVIFNAAGTGRAQISGTALALGAANRTFTVGLGAGATEDLLIDAQITGVRSLTKAGLGRLTLANTNAYTLGTTISAGTLLLSGANHMPTAGTLAVSSGGTFSLADGTARATTGASSGVGLTLATGSTMAFDWNGGSLDSFTLTGTATATSTGSVGIIINNTSPTGSGGTLITATGLSTLNTASYFLANNTDYTATISKTATTVSIGAQSAVAALTDAYWKRNQVTGATDTMAYSLGALSNWASNAAGTSAGGVVPGGNAVNVIFGATSASGSVTVGANMNLGSITFNDTAAVTIAGGNTITLNSTSGTAASTLGALQTVTAGSAISVTSFANAANTISANLALGANQTWNVASGKTLVVSGQVAGGYGLTKDDAGTLTLSGANTYTGGTTISAGTLKVGNATALGANSSAVSVTSGAAFDLNGITMTGSNALTLNGSGISSGGALTGSGTYAGAIILGSATTIGTGSGTMILSGGLNNGGNLLTINGAGNVTFSVGAISGLGGITMNGTGTLTLGGASTPAHNYTGTTTLNAGITMFNNNYPSGNITLNGGLMKFYAGTGTTRALGAGVGQIQIIGGSSGFDGNNGACTVNFGGAGAEVQWGSAFFNPTTLRFQDSATAASDTLTFANAIDLNAATRTIAVNGSASAGAVTFSGLIRTSSGTAGLIKTGVGTLVLTNAGNSYNGDTTVSGGILRIGTGGRLGSGTYAGGIDIASGATFDYNSTANQTLNGAITGAGILQKSSTGRLTLGNTANTYTGGTVLTGGILFAPTTTVMASNYLTAGKVTFNGGALAVRIGTGDDWSTAEIDALQASAIKTSGGLGLDTSNGDFTQWTGFSPTYFGGGFSLAKLGSNTLTLNQNNTFVGGLLIDQGTVFLDHASGLYGTSASANSVTFTTGNTGKLTLNGNSLIVRNLDGASGTHTVENANATAASLTIGNAANAASTFAGVIQDGTGGGALSLIKAGAGTLTLSGTNTFTGGIFIGAGTVVLSNQAAWGNAGARNITFNGTGTLTGADGQAGNQLSALSGTATISGNNITFATTTGSGRLLTTAGTNKTVNIGDASAFTGNLGVSYKINSASTIGTPHLQFSKLSDTVGSSIQFYRIGGGTSTTQNAQLGLSGDAGPVTFDNRQIQLLPKSGTTNPSMSDVALVNSNTNALNQWVINTNLGISTYDRNVNFYLMGGNTGGNAFNGTIGNPTGFALSLVKAGTGNWILSGNNTYTGATTITGGTLQVSGLANGGANSNIGASSNAAGNLILNGGTLRYTGAAVSTDRLFSLQTTSSISSSGSGAISFTNAGAMGFNTGVAAKTLTLTGPNTATNTIAAVIGENTGATAITKTGIGTWVLGGSNTNTGATAVSGGGALVLDYGTNDNNKIAGILTLGGGTLTLKGATGAHVEVVTSTSLNAGGTFLTRDGVNTARLNMNAITRAAGGTISFGDATIADTDTNNFGASGANGIIGGWATLGNDWAVSANTGAANTAITALGSYTSFVNTGGSSTTNYLLNGVLSGDGNLAGGVAAGSLKITNTADSQAFGLGTNNLTVTSTSATALGGIMYAGGNDNLYSITGGTGRIVTSTANQELIFAVQTGTLSVGAFVGASGSTGGVTKSGAGTLVLSAANNYTGITRVNQGTLRLANNAGAGTTAGNIDVQNGATLELANSVAIGTELLTITGSGVSNGGALRNVASNTSSYAGAITIGNGGARINSDASGALTLSGGVVTSLFNDVTFGGAGNTTVQTVAISGAGGLIKDGAGTLVLSGANTYSGVTLVNAGTLQFATQATLYNNTSASWTAANINVKSAATLALNVDSSGTAGFTGASLDTLLTNTSVANTAAEGLQSGATIGLDSSTATGGTFTQGNAIANSTGANGGAIGVTKLGTGTLVLDQVNLYTGATTVGNGTLAIGGSGSIASSSLIQINESTILDVSAVTGDFTIGAAQIVAGTGTILATGRTVVAEGTLSSGNSLGALTQDGGNLKLGANGNINWQIVDAAGLAGTGYDTVNLTNGATLDLSMLGAGNEYNINLWSLSGIGPDVNGNADFFDNTVNYAWTLFSTDTAISGFATNKFIIHIAANNLAGGFANDLGGGGFSVGLSGDNTDIMLNFTAIPEPTTALLGCLGLLLILRRRR